MNEAETRAEHIDLVLQAADWGGVEVKARHKSRIYLSPPLLCMSSYSHLIADLSFKDRCS